MNLRCADRQRYDGERFTLIGGADQGEGQTGPVPRRRTAPASILGSEVLATA